METVIYNEKEHRVFQVITKYGTYNVILVAAKYTSGDKLAIEMLCVEDGQVTEPFSVLTVNIPNTMFCEDNQAFVDTNNNAFAEKFIKKNKLGEYAGADGASGYCSYPLYTFDIEKFTVNR